MEAQARSLRATAKSLRELVPPSDGAEWMTPADASRKYGAKPTSIRLAARDGKVESRRVGRDVLVKSADVERWIVSQKTAAPRGELGERRGSFQRRGVSIPERPRGMQSCGPET